MHTRRNQYKEQIPAKNYRVRAKISTLDQIVVRQNCVDVQRANYGAKKSKQNEQTIVFVVQKNMHASRKQYN